MKANLKIKLNEHVLKGLECLIYNLKIDINLVVAGLGLDKRKELFYKELNKNN